MTTQSSTLWSIARGGRPQVDPHELARAVEAAVAGVARPADLDYRTRLLVRDSLDALAKYWGRERVDAWLATSPVGARALAVWQSSFDGDTGFPSLAGRIMEHTTPAVLRQFLRELSLHVHRPTRLLVGGSGSLILLGKLSRQTDDVDVVDEVPAELREQHAVLDRLAQEYGLRLAHFQSHYLPDGWATRVHAVGAYGALEVVAVDPYDVFVGKLFSRREKDRSDLRALAEVLDRATVEARYVGSTAALRADARLFDAARENWFVVYGGELPDT